MISSPEGTAVEQTTGLVAAAEMSEEFAPTQRLLGAELPVQAAAELLAELGFADYSRTVEGLQLTSSEEFDTTQTLIGLIGAAEQAGELQRPELEAQALRLQNRLVVASLFKVVQVVRVEKKRGNKYGWSTLTTAGNELLYKWYRKEFGTAKKANEAPVYPVDYVIDDAVRPGLRYYQPKPAKSQRQREVRPQKVALPQRAKMAPKLWRIGWTRYKQSYLKNLLEIGYSKPPAPFRPVIDPVDRPVQPPEDYPELFPNFGRPDKAPKLWRIGETVTRQTFLSNLILPKRTPPTESNCLRKTDTENEVVQAVPQHKHQRSLLDELHNERIDLEFDRLAQAARAAKEARSSRERKQHERADKRKDRTTGIQPDTGKDSGKSAGKLKTGGGSYAAAMVFEKQRRSSIDQKDDSLLSMVLSYVLDEDSGVDYVVIGQAFHEDIRKALRDCLHTEEYVSLSQVRSVSERFSRISRVAQNAPRRKDVSKKKQVIDFRELEGPNEDDLMAAG